MIRHEYAACATCHADPSGGGLLTPGRAQREILLRTYYGSEKAEDRDAGTLGDFAFGAVTLPKQLLLQSDVRGLLLHAIPENGRSDTRLVHMQSDVATQLTLDRFRANVSLGYMHRARRRPGFSAARKTTIAYHAGSNHAGEFSHAPCSSLERVTRNGRLPGLVAKPEEAPPPAPRRRHAVCFAPPEVLERCIKILRR